MITVTVEVRQVAFHGLPVELSHTVYCRLLTIGAAARRCRSTGLTVLSTARRAVPCYSDHPNPNRWGKCVGCAHPSATVV